MVSSPIPVAMQLRSSGSGRLLLFLFCHADNFECYVDASAIKVYCCTDRITLGSEIVLQLWVYNLSGTALSCFSFPFLTQHSDSASAGCVVADIFCSVFGGYCVYR
jgi:hypothetical protein